MNNFTEQDRIEQFKKTMKYCMPNRFPEGFIDTLKEKGFFTARLPFTTTGHIQGRYSIIHLLLQIPFYPLQSGLN